MCGGDGVKDCSGDEGCGANSGTGLDDLVVILVVDTGLGGGECFFFVYGANPFGGNKMGQVHGGLRTAPFLFTFTTRRGVTGSIIGPQSMMRCNTL